MAPTTTTDLPDAHLVRSRKALQIVVEFAKGVFCMVLSPLPTYLPILTLDERKRRKYPGAAIKKSHGQRKRRVLNVLKTKERRSETKCFVFLLRILLCASARVRRLYTTYSTYIAGRGTFFNKKKLGQNQTNIRSN